LWLYSMVDEHLPPAEKEYETKKLKQKEPAP
jgi:hypothetical protein